MTSQAFPRPGRARRAGARRPAARVVRPKVRPLVVFTLVAVAAFFVMIFARISLDRSAFELQHLERSLAAEQAKHWEMRVEIARLRDPARISSAAADLGMVNPEERVPLVVEGLPASDEGVEYRWEDLRALLSAQP